MSYIRDVINMIVRADAERREFAMESVLERYGLKPDKAVGLFEFRDYPYEERSAPLMRFEIWDISKGHDRAFKVWPISLPKPPK